MSNAGGIVKQPGREVIHRRWMQLRFRSGHVPAGYVRQKFMQDRARISYRFKSREPDRLGMRMSAERDTTPTLSPRLPERQATSQNSQRSAGRSQKN